VVRIAAVHGYDLRRPAGRLRVLAQNIYRQAAKKLSGCLRSNLN